MNSWIDIPKNSDFSIYNLPFGIFSSNKNSKRVGVAIGNNIIDLLACNELDIFKDLNINNNVFENNFLNDFINLGKNKTNKVREIIQQQLTDESSKIKMSSVVIIPMNEAEMHLPVKVGDYTDFYSSIEHATNIGSMFRDPSNPLLPNWRHLPVGYHGRASSIIVSGTDIFRPKGQVMPLDSDKPVFTPSKRIDFELEMGYIIGKNSSLGSSITTDDADNYIFGKVLFNDWSARDIQKWEYVPLGPFLGKSFASSISPWIVTLDALEPFRVPGEKQEPAVLPYLEFEGNKNIDINLEVLISSENFDSHTISKSNYKYMYWNMTQQLAHHTINGCNINAGDMMASGTISGNAPEAYGSMLELSWKGTKPIPMPDNSERKFLQDNDCLIMRAHCQAKQYRIGFGEVKTKILPAKELNL